MPDPVEPFVVGVEVTDVFPVAVNRGRTDPGQLHLRPVRRNLKPHEAERGIAEVDLPQHRNRQQLLMRRVIGGRRAEGFGNRFAERDLQGGALHRIGVDRQLAVQFDPEVEQEFAARRNDTGIRRKTAEALDVHPVQQAGGVAHVSAFADQSHRGDETAAFVIRNHAGIAQAELVFLHIHFKIQSI